MKKLTVTQNGTLIGKRGTDRDYKFVVAQTGMDVTVYRNRMAKFNADMLRGECTASYKYNQQIAAGSMGYRDATIEEQQTAKDRLAKWGTLEQHLTAQAVRLDMRVEQFVADWKPNVRSWHGSRALADKALRGFSDNLGCFTYAILPVDAQ